MLLSAHSFFAVFLPSFRKKNSNIIKKKYIYIALHLQSPQTHKRCKNVLIFFSPIHEYIRTQVRAEHG